MKINQLSAPAGNTDAALRSLAVNEFMAGFPLANYAEFYPISGNADTPRKVDANISAGDNRTIATDYTAKSNTPGFGAVVLKIYGDKVETDYAYERRSQDIGSQRARDLANFSRSLGRYFMDAVVNDELSATKFSGLKEQATALGVKTVFDTANGGELPSGNGNTERKQQDKFIEILTAQLSAVRPSVMLMNGALMARLASVGRSYLSTTTVKDIYGNEYLIRTFYDVPIIDPGFKANNSGLILPSNETEGTSTSKCTSIYMVRFGEEMDTTFATNVGMDVKDLGMVGTKYTTLVEFDVDLAVLDKTSLTRISGIML